MIYLYFECESCAFGKTSDQADIGTGRREMLTDGWYCGIDGDLCPECAPGPRDDEQCDRCAVSYLEGDGVNRWGNTFCSELCRNIFAVIT